MQKKRNILFFKLFLTMCMFQELHPYCEKETACIDVNTGEETFGCTPVPKMVRACPRTDRPPHKPHESSYYESRNRGMFNDAHSTIKIVDTNIFKYISFSDLEYEPFVTTRVLKGFVDQQTYLFPARPVFDAYGQDVQARKTIQLTYFHFLFGSYWILPEAFCANPYIDFVVEFYGPTGYNFIEVNAVGQGLVGTGGNALIYGALYMDWEKTSLIFGRTWNPWVDPEIQVSNQRVTTLGCIAETLERDYQFRITQEVTDNIDLIACVFGTFDTQLTSRNNGFVNEPDVLFDVPQIDLHLQVRAYDCDNIFAAGIDIASEKPAKFNDWQLTFTVNPVPLNSANIFKAEARVVSVSGFLFGKLEFEKCIIRAKTFLGSSIVNDLGGYAVTNRSMNVNAQGIKLPPCVQYSPLRVAEVVADITFPRDIEPGLFFSFTKNYGASKPLFQLDPAVYPTRTGDDRFLIFNVESNLDYTFTISPRVKCHSGSVSLCAEIEFFRAAYGDINPYGAISCSSPVNNVRFIFSAQAFF